MSEHVRVCVPVCVPPVSSLCFAAWVGVGVWVWVGECVRRGRGADPGRGVRLDVIPPPSQPLVVYAYALSASPSNSKAVHLPCYCRYCRYPTDVSGDSLSHLGLLGVVCGGGAGVIQPGCWRPRG